MLLELGASVDRDVLRPRGLRSPVAIAARNGNAHCVAKLLHDGGRMVGGTLPLLEAVRGRSAACVKLLAVHVDGAVHGETALHITIRLGIVDIVDILLEAGAPVDAMDIWGKTPLYVACSLSDDATATRLIAANATVNTFAHNGRSPLWLAVEDKNLALVKILLLAGADPETTRNNTTVLMLACMLRLRRIAEALLKANADPNSAFMGVVLEGYTTMVRVLHTAGAVLDRPDAEGFTALGRASMADYDCIAQILLELGADCELGNATMTPLVLACTANSYSVAYALLRWRVNLYNQHPSPLEAAAKSGALRISRLLLMTSAPAEGDPSTGPLALATLNNRTEIVGLLLKAGVPAQNESLWQACALGYPEIVDLLLKAGSDPCYAEGGFTCLHIAVRLEDVFINQAVVQKLACYGARVQCDARFEPNYRYWLKSIEEHTPIQICVGLGEVDIATLHLRRGAVWYLQPACAVHSLAAPLVATLGLGWSQSRHFLFGPVARRTIWMLLWVARHVCAPAEVWMLIRESVSRN
jgi:ankyrin repeat protein